MTSTVGKQIERSVFGIPVHWCGQGSMVVQASRELFLDFSDPLESNDSNEPVEIRITEVQSKNDIPLAITASDVLRTPSNRHHGFRLFARQRSRLIQMHDGSLFHIDPTLGRLDGWLVATADSSIDSIGNLLRLALLEMLRLRGLYSVHGAGLERNGRGFLFVGPSGHGKTTSCLALVRAGYRCLSDDHTFLRETDQGLELLPFPGRIDTTDRTLRFFPELEQDSLAKRQGPLKKSFRLEEAYRGRTATACRPAYLIFPRIVDAPQSRLEPMLARQALEELLPETVMILDPEQGRRQFETCVRLARECEAFRLHFGRDVDDLARTIDSLWSARIAA